ncbi:MAG: site-2 protease family protein [Vicinamibacterales bacterium]
MSTESPAPDSELKPTSFEPAGVEPSYTWVAAPPPPRVRFQHNYRLHITLFLLTLFTTTFNPVLEYLWLWLARAVQGPNPLYLFVNPLVILTGLMFSLPILMILSAHEFGHYVACRIHQVDATLPYFLPLPLPPTGTLGAVIRIKEVFPSKRALFDIGVAGPIAGFVMLLPFLYWGVTLSTVGPVAHGPDVLEFGEPLLFKAFAWLHFGAIPDGQEVYLHPMGFAAWWGMLATALNLLPFGQLDGGHIVYSLLGRRSSYVSIATVGVAMLLTLRSMSWISVTVMMLVMAFFLGVRHPRIRDEETPLDSRRRVVAFCALVIFVLCFTPVPIQTFFGK